MAIACSILSIVTFIAFGYDKLAARRNDRRISEGTLHLLSLCGGWPGGLAGQLLFRHKTHKPVFRVCFWLTVLINGAILLYWRGQHL